MYPGSRVRLDFLKFEHERVDVESISREAGELIREKFDTYKFCKLHKIRMFREELAEHESHIRLLRSLNYVPTLKFHLALAKSIGFTMFRRIGPICRIKPTRLDAIADATCASRTSRTSRAPGGTYRRRVFFEKVRIWSNCSRDSKFLGKFFYYFINNTTIQIMSANISTSCFVQRVVLFVLKTFELGKQKNLTCPTKIWGQTRGEVCVCCSVKLESKTVKVRMRFVYLTLATNSLSLCKEI